MLVQVRRVNRVLGQEVLVAPSLSELGVATRVNDEHLEHHVLPSKTGPVQALDLQWEKTFSHDNTTAVGLIKIIVQ